MICSGGVDGIASTPLGLEGAEAMFRSKGKRDIPIKGNSSGRSYEHGLLPLPATA
jgi:hypothetical protein